MSRVADATNNSFLFPPFAYHQNTNGLRDGWKKTREMPGGFLLPYEPQKSSVFLVKMLIVHSYVTVYQKVNLHFPMVFPMICPFSHGCSYSIFSQRWPIAAQVGFGRRLTCPHIWTTPPAAEPAAKKIARFSFDAAWKQGGNHQGGNSGEKSRGNHLRKLCVRVNI